MKLFKRIFSAITIFSVVLAACSCSNEAAVEAEIQIPVLEGGTASAFSTAVVEIKDIEVTQKVGGSIGYIYADTLFTDFESNIIEYKAERGQQLKEGDVIAVFDSSSLDYDYTSQKILADDAYAKYLSSGSEKARLEYEIQSKKLEYIQYQIDNFTIKAPYDCIVTGTESFTAGEVVNAGTPVCTVARENEIYLYTSENTDLFKVGTRVEAKFGTNEAYKARAVMVPDAGRRDDNERRGSVNINKCVSFKFEDGELERLINDVDNVITAGWATIIVPTVQKYSVMTLPEEAVATFSGSTYCSILNNGMQVRVPVEVSGVYNGSAVIVSGLREGDEVVY